MKFEVDGHELDDLVQGLYAHINLIIESPYANQRNFKEIVDRKARLIIKLRPDQKTLIQHALLKVEGT